MSSELKGIPQNALPEGEQPLAVEGWSLVYNRNEMWEWRGAIDQTLLIRSGWKKQRKD